MNPELLKQARTVAAMTGRRIRMRIPSILAAGETFALDISVMGADGLPCTDLTNTFHFEDCIGIDGLPKSFTLAEGESTAHITGLSATGDEVALVRARMEGTGHLDGDPVIASNPAWIFDDPPYRLFWGDIHIHTSYSNCNGWRCLDPAWAYEFAREISLLDFAAPADHLRGIVSDETRWPRLQQLAKKYNDPGRFVSILAFESSHMRGYGGDNNVYYLDDDAPHFWVDREDMRGISPAVHLTEMWEQLDKNGKPYFTIPHHTGRMGKFRSWDEDYYDAGHEPLFEIYSSWGSSEMRWSRFPLSGANNDEPSYFTDALKAGTRFGVIASSDDHATLPGAVHQHRVQPFEIPNLNDQPQQGLAAVRAPALTREALFNAMQSRNTYATTLARSLVDVRIGDLSMGQEAKADAGLRKKREIRVDLTLENARRASVTLMRNGEVLTSGSVADDASTRRNTVVFEDTEPLENIAVKDAKFHPDPFVVYYAKVQDNHGWHQWTSPIWIDV